MIPLPRKIALKKNVSISLDNCRIDAKGDVSRVASKAIRLLTRRYPAIGEEGKFQVIFQLDDVERDDDRGGTWEEGSGGASAGTGARAPGTSMVGNDPGNITPRRHVPGHDGKEKEGGVNGENIFSPFGPEHYRLLVDDEGILVMAGGEAGFLHAVQTLLQAAAKDGVVPGMDVLDWPAFPLRGFMHDLGRNFQSIDCLEKQVDVLCRYKINVFHMHLTENHAWRVESIKYPELVDPKNHLPTRQPGKHYTIEELRGFQDYCAERGITIIPELDMPGHSKAFSRAMGFDMQTSRGEAVLRDLIAEWCSIFDGPFFHLGSDEVIVRRRGFMKRMAREVERHGKRVVTWVPGKVPPGDTIGQLWARGKPGRTRWYIDSRDRYINNMDPFTGTARLFFLLPGGMASSDGRCLGSILCHWPDIRVEGDWDTFRTNAIWPFTLAHAERAWRGGGGVLPNRGDLVNGDRFRARLPNENTTEFAIFKEFEDRLVAHRDQYFPGQYFQYVRQTQARWRLIGPFDHGGDVTRSFPPESRIQDEYVVDGKVYRWEPRVAVGATIFAWHFFGHEGWLPGAARKKEGTFYALARLHSDASRDIGAWIGFDEPNSSNRPVRSTVSGTWSNAMARIWVNGSEIPAPMFKNGGLAPGWKSPAQEIPLLDEGYFYRPPARIHLEKGWNDVLVKVPHRNKHTYKWKFTFMPVETSNGIDFREVEGICFAGDPLAPQGLGD